MEYTTHKWSTAKMQSEKKNVWAQQAAKLSSKNAVLNHSALVVVGHRYPSLSTLMRSWKWPYKVKLQKAS
jgi:hypothetical protein